MADADENIPLLDPGRKNSQNDIDNDGRENLDNVIDIDGRENPENYLVDDGRENLDNVIDIDGRENPENYLVDDGRENPQNDIDNDGRENLENVIDIDGRGNPENDKDNGEIKCEACSWSEIINIEDIKPGDHIVMVGCCYNHHAIVKEVNGNKFSLIHYWRNQWECPKMSEDEFCFDKFKTVQRISYEHSNSNDDRVRKAQTALKNGHNYPYSPLSNNCEHFCHDVCIDRKTSKQVYNCCNKSWLCFLSVISCAPIRYIFVVLYFSMDDLMPSMSISVVIWIVLLVGYIVYVICVNRSWCLWLCKTPCCNLNELCEINFENYCQDCQDRYKCLNWIRLALVFVFQLMDLLFLFLLTKYKLSWYYRIFGLVFGIFTCVANVCLEPCCLSRCCLKQRTTGKNVEKQSTEN